MSDLFRKLNLKDQRAIVVLGAPAELNPELVTLKGVEIHDRLPSEGAIEFLLAFATKKAEVDELAVKINGQLDHDAVVWIAYPKGSSKRYRADFNRDSGWDRVGAIGLEPVRQVAIDQDWSALRFRQVEHIRKLTRDPERALSTEGREKASRGRRSTMNDTDGTASR